MSYQESPKTFPLITAFRAGEKDSDEVAEITLREPTAGEIEQMQKDEARDGAATALIKLMAKQSKLAPVDIRKLGARDFTALQDYLMSFFGKAPGSSES